MPERLPVDVLLVSPGTTAGWRRVDADFARLVSDLGLTVAMSTTDFRLARHLRRTVPLTDLAEAAAMRHALSRSLRLYRPRAIIYSSTQALMLQPARRLHGAAVRFDALTTRNRPGRLNGVQHRLERRALARMALLLPAGLDPARRLPPDLADPARAIALPLPVTPGAPIQERLPIALCYAGNPGKKGLDVITRAWALASPAGHRLVVTGIDAEAGRAHLRSHGVPVPAGVEWAGVVSARRFRELTGAAELFVSASRFEDYGMVQLEALSDGALLVSTPSAGPYEALPVARALGHGLVAASGTPEALAAALTAGLALPADARESYRAHARELLAPYSFAELRRRVEDLVLPGLGLR